jgi:hypothetical protein
MDNEKMPKNAEKYVCKKCNFICCKKSNFDAHLLTAKHRRITKDNGKSPKNAKAYICNDCGSVYKFSSGLSKHRKKCSEVTKEDESNELTTVSEPVSAELMMKVMNQMSEQMTTQQHTINELHSEMRRKDDLMGQMIDKVGITNNNINTINNNNNVNINMFLNEQCKNAVNFTDFIEGIEVSHDDLENNAELGFVGGISKILMDNLNQLTLYERPIHCTDVKRDTLYIKNDNEWKKEKCLDKMNNAIQAISRKSIGSLMDWKRSNPDYQDLDSEFSNRCLHMQMQSIAGDNRDKLYPKIIKNIAKENHVSYR